MMMQQKWTKRKPPASVRVVYAEDSPNYDIVQEYIGVYTCVCVVGWQLY